MVEKRNTARTDKKVTIKRRIDLDVVSSLDKDLRQELLELYTDTLVRQEERKRNHLISEARKVFEVKTNLVKGLGKNNQEREHLLALVSSFPIDEPTTEKGWSRVLGIMERKGKKKTKKVVEFPVPKSKSKASPKKVPTKPKSKSTKKK